MFDDQLLLTWADEPAAAPAAPPPAPGKRTLTAAIQRSPAGATPADPWATRSFDPTARLADPFALHVPVTEIAAGGLRGSGGALPHLDTIQRAFGRHDVGHVSAHVGGAATDATAALGARAYAMGDAIAFAGAPDLHTAAHEAAHVVQQRAGVHLKDGLDDGAGDPYERHADAVADAVVAGRSAEALLDAPPSAAPAPAAAPVQRIKLAPGEHAQKLRRAKSGEKATVDTLTLGEDALRALVTDMESYNAMLAREIRTEWEKQAKKGGSADKLELDDIAEVFALEAELTALELVKKNQGADQLDARRAEKVGAKLAAAHVLLQSVLVPSEASIYRDTIAAFTARLVALDKKFKPKHQGADALDVDVAIDGAARTGYKNDIQQNGAWGGLAEADVIARLQQKTIQIFRLDHANLYRRVTTIGAGGASTHHLLHLGNHYVAIAATVVDGGAPGAGDGRIETTPDGNCMYEALYVCTAGHAPATPLLRTNFITRMRAYVSGHISDDAVDTSIVGLLAGGDQAGLGANMKGFLQGKQDDARIKELSPKEVASRLARFAAIKDPSGLDYAEKAETYLAARKSGAGSAKTKAALGELEEAFGAAEVALAQQSHAIDPSQIELPLDWFEVVKRAAGDKVLGADDPRTILAAQVRKFNDAARSGALSIRGRLALLDALEGELKQVPYEDAADPMSEDVRIALFRFQTVSVRKVRANLVGLYQLTEGSRFRTGAPGNRPDLHYDVHADGEEIGQGQFSTPLPSSIGAKEERDLRKEFKPDSPKDLQETLSAAALKARYPAKFSKITKARRFTDLKRDVEYWDNDGMPWDQVSGHSYAKGEPDPVPNLRKAIIDHLSSAKDYPNRSCTGAAAGQAPLYPSGVVLDCTYLDHNDYTRLWAALIETVDPATLRDRVAEINVPFADKDVKPAYSRMKHAPVTNTTHLDECREGVKGDESGRIYAIAASRVATYISDIETELAAIRAGKGRPGDHPVYRNHGEPLPNLGSYFLEFYCSAGTMPDGGALRLVYDKPNDIFYLTGTHYRPFMSPYSSAMRNPFYRLT